MEQLAWLLLLITFELMRHRDAVAVGFEPTEPSVGELKRMRGAVDVAEPDRVVAAGRVAAVEEAVLDQDVARVLVRDEVRAEDEREVLAVARSRLLRMVSPLTSSMPMQSTCAP